MSLKKIDQAYEIAGDNRLLLLGDFNVPGIDWKGKDLKGEPQGLIN